MQIEIAVIYKLLKENNLDVLISENIRPELFIDNKDVFTYILNYFDSYNILPSPQIILKSFGTLDKEFFKEDLYQENLLFYVDKLKERKKYHILRDINDYLSLNLDKNVDEIHKSSKILRDNLDTITLLTSKTKDIRAYEYRDKIKEDYNKRKNSKGLLGIPYRWDSLNKLTKGLQKYYITVGGFHKVGKTFILLSILIDILKEDKKVLLFSREMSAKQILRRIVSLKYNLPLAKVDDGNLIEEAETKFFNKLDADEELKNLIINEDIAEKGKITINYIKSRVNLYKPDYVLIDGTYLLDDDEYSKNRVEKGYNISRGLKILSNTLGVGVISTVQLNKEGTTKWSAGYEDDADLVIRIIKEKDERVREIEVYLHRHGETGRFFIDFDLDLGCFFNENDKINSRKDNTYKVEEVTWSYDNIPNYGY